MSKPIRRRIKKRRRIIAVSDFEGDVRLATSILRMAGPLWDEGSLDAADVSGPFRAVLVRNAMPRHGLPSNVNVMMRIAGAQDLQCIALSRFSLRFA